MDIQQQFLTNYMNSIIAKSKEELTEIIDNEMNDIAKSDYNQKKKAGLAD